LEFLLLIVDFYLFHLFGVEMRLFVATWWRETTWRWGAIAGAPVQ